MNLKLKVEAEADNPYVSSSAAKTASFQSSPPRAPLGASFASIALFASRRKSAQINLSSTPPSPHSLPPSIAPRLGSDGS